MCFYFQNPWSLWKRMSFGAAAHPQGTATTRPSPKQTLTASNSLTDPN